MGKNSFVLMREAGKEEIAAFEKLHIALVNRDPGKNKFPKFRKWLNSN